MERCGKAVMQLDFDEEMGPLYGMYGSMVAEHEVQRTINRAELTAFLCLLRKVLGPVKVHVDKKGYYLMGYEKDKSIVSSHEQEVQTCGSKFGKNCMNW